MELQSVQEKARLSAIPYLGQKYKQFNYLLVPRTTTPTGSLSAQVQRQVEVTIVENLFARGFDEERLFRVLVRRPESSDSVDVSLQYSREGKWEDVVKTKLQTSLNANERLYTLTDVKVSLEHGFADRLCNVVEFANQISLQRQNQEHHKNALIEVERSSTVKSKTAFPAQKLERCNYEEHTLTVVNRTNTGITIEVSGKTSEIAENEEARFGFNGKPIVLQGKKISFGQSEQIIKLGNNTFAQLQTNGSSSQICVRPALRIVNATDKVVKVNEQQVLQNESTYVNAAACCFEIDEQRSEQIQNDTLAAQKVVQVGELYLRVEHREKGSLSMLKLFPTFVIENQLENEIQLDQVCIKPQQTHCYYSKPDDNLQVQSIAYGDFRQEKAFFIYKHKASGFKSHAAPGEVKTSWSICKRFLLTHANSDGANERQQLYV